MLIPAATIQVIQKNSNERLVKKIQIVYSLKKHKKNDHCDRLILLDKMGKRDEAFYTHRMKDT